MNNLVKTGAAVAGILGATAAFALPPTPFNPDVQVFLSGASAQDNGIERVLRQACIAGTLDLYRNGNNQRAWYCQMNNTTVPGINGPGANGLANVAVYKNSNGGSGAGVSPLAQGATLPFIDIPNAGTSCTTSTPVGAQGSFIAYTDRSGCGTQTIPRVPQIGFSDVEPKLLDAAAAPLLTSVGANQVIIGIPVSTNLRNALQATQGLSVGSDTYTNMPSLTSTQIAGLFTGAIVDWTQLTNASGTAVAAPSSNDTGVYVCRRVSSSGTQAITEVHFLRQRCEIGTSSFVSDNNPAGDTSATPWNGLAGSFGGVQANSGSGDVVNCLHNANTNNLYAIGLLSSEVGYTNSSGQSFDFRYIKVDGYAPTLSDVVNTNYSFYAEQAVNTRTGLALPAQVDTFRGYLIGRLSSPTVIAQLNTGFRHVWGDGGLLGVPDINNLVLPPSPASQANLRTTPVNSTFKAPSGTTNNCQVFPYINGASTKAGAVAFPQ